MNTRIDAGLHHQVVRGLQIIWLAFVGSIGLYVFILLLLSEQSEPVEADFVEVLRPVFWVLATILTIATFIWRQQVADLERPRRRTTASGFERLRVACIVTWALSEAVGVLGLCLGSITYAHLDYMPFVFLAIALLFVHRPAAWPIERFLREDYRR